MKILLAVDESPHSRAAADWVRAMKWPAGTTIHLLTVARPLVSAYSTIEAGGYTYAPEIHQENLKFHEELVAGFERPFRELGYTVTASVAQGDPRDAIVEAASAGRADLLVLGSHGRTGLARVLLGSVAYHVVQHATCNVMVVKLAKT